MGPEEFSGRIQGEQNLLMDAARARAKAGDDEKSDGPPVPPPG
jgi:hypothetical protein